MSKIEIRDIILSVLVLSFAFSKFYGFEISLFVSASVFVLHELGHRFTARRFGAHAEYRMWPFGLLLCAIMAIMPGGLIFAAPGAVYYTTAVRKEFAWDVHRLTHKEIGLISLAGPAANIITGMIFFAAAAAAPDFAWLLRPAANIAMFLALFNLLPFGPLDGRAVFSWNRWAWAAITGLAGVSYFLVGI
ncbi:MAG: site-2 protease family protein [Candidatus Aenigmatarchaeota archaeon]